MYPYLSMIAIFGFNFAPRGWATCSGQSLPINQYTALFSLLGTTFGGNGINNFALPDLRGRIPVGFGQGPGLSFYSLGQQTGTETTSLLPGNLPPHSHRVTASTESGDTASPEGAFPAGTGVFDRDYRTATDTPVMMQSQMLSIEGSNMPVSLMNPVLALNYCIAMEGIFPPRQ